MRRDIEWKIKREDGTSCEVRVSAFAGKFKFQYREKHDETWDYNRKPSRADLETLVDGVKRRYQRRQASQKDVDEAERLLRESI